MTKILPIIVADNTDNEPLNNKYFDQVKNTIGLNNRDVFHPSFLLGTAYVLPTLYDEVKNKSDIEFANVYASEPYKVSLMDMLVVSKIADNKYPGTPILMLHPTMMREDRQNDHLNDLKANISDVKNGKIVVFETSTHMSVDAMFTYQGLLDKCLEFFKDEKISFQKNNDIFQMDRGKIVAEDARLSLFNVREALHIHINDKIVCYTSEKPELYSPWKTYASN